VHLIDGSFQNPLFFAETSEILSSPANPSTVAPHLMRGLAFLRRASAKAALARIKCGLTVGVVSAIVDHWEQWERRKTYRELPFSSQASAHWQRRGGTLLRYSMIRYRNPSPGVFE
jgi:hypothetical protein